MSTIIRVLFWGYNVLMLLWIIGGTSANVDKMNTLGGAELAGAQIGTGLGVLALLVLWVLGAAILGLMVLVTRPSRHGA